METITVNAAEWNELVRKINLIAEFIGQLAGQLPADDNAWMDEAQVCGYLKVSTKTLQRLRNSGDIKYCKYSVNPVFLSLLQHVSLLAKQNLYAKQKVEHRSF
ncbi:helix-turn-helix domain-containing protein [Dysgonomonas reticulitermitis]